MWYFAWILGLSMAAFLAVLNVMWLELQEDERLMQSKDDPDAK